MILLSHPVSPDTPMYGNSKFPIFSTSKCMKQGDSCNQLMVTMSNHTSTHIDCPAHFSLNGKTLSDYPANFWFARHCLILEMPAPPANASLISGATIKSLIDSQSSKSNQDVEAVVLKTGFGQHRNTDVYWQTPPGFEPDVADCLRTAFPQIRFFAFDLISLSSFSHREVGRLAHRKFLDHKHPILIIEDLDLSAISRTTILQNLLISPLFLKDADGAPCSIWGNIS